MNPQINVSILVLREIDSSPATRNNDNEYEKRNFPKMKKNKKNCRIVIDAQDEVEKN